MMLYSVTVIW